MAWATGTAFVSIVPYLNGRPKIAQMERKLSGLKTAAKAVLKRNMRTHFATGSLFVIATAACHKPPPTAASVCGQLAAAGLAANCHDQVPRRINARAKEESEFDLPSVPGHGGAAFSFVTAEDYKATVDAYASMSLLTGSHRYGNERARIFVQLNEDAPADVGQRTKAIVDGL
jgi:hypothetical protein